MANAIVLRDDSISAPTKVARLATVVIAQDWAMPADRVMFLDASMALPRLEMVSAAFAFLEHWEAAAPFAAADHGREDRSASLLACDIGTVEERAATAGIIGDLRQPVYDPRLLLVRRDSAGGELVHAWREECQDGEDERLAFLRALHVVKPRFYALPPMWITEVGQRQERRPIAKARERLREAAGEALPAMVLVQVGPRRYLRCHHGEEEEAMQNFRSAVVGRRPPVRGRN